MLVSELKAIKLMTVPTIVYVYPTAAWCDSLGRQFALTRAFARLTKAVYLEVLPRRRLLDFAKPRIELDPDNVLVVRNALSLRFSRLGKRVPALAGFIDSKWLHKEFRRHGITQYVYWTSACDFKLLHGMDLRQHVYDCIDPCFSPEHQSAFDAMEFAFAKRAKLTFATAEALLERLQPINSNSYLLPNGAPNQQNSIKATKTLKILRIALRLSSDI